MGAAPPPKTEKPFELDDLATMEVRTEQLIWLPGVLVDIEDFPDVFGEEFCEWLPKKADSPIYRQLPALSRFAAGDEMPEPQDVAEALVLNGAAGFLVQAAAAVKKYASESGIYYSGWGHVRLEWLYAATEADIGPVILAWAEEWDARWRAEFAASQSGAAAERTASASEGR